MEVEMMMYGGSFLCLEFIEGEVDHQQTITHPHTDAQG